MNRVAVAGIVLLFMGIIFLSFDRIYNTHQEIRDDLEPIKTTIDKKESTPAVLIGGWALMLGGLVLVIISSKKNN